MIFRKGRVLRATFGCNPNSSSLGVDVTFLLFGMAAVALLTPIVALLLRARGLLGGAGTPPSLPQPSLAPPSLPEPSGEAESR